MALPACLPLSLCVSSLSFSCLPVSQCFDSCTVLLFRCASHVGHSFPAVPCHSCVCSCVFLSHPGCFCSRDGLLLASAFGGHSASAFALLGISLHGILGDHLSLSCCCACLRALTLASFLRSSKRHGRYTLDGRSATLRYCQVPILSCTTPNVFPPSLYAYRFLCLA